MYQRDCIRKNDCIGKVEPNQIACLSEHNNHIKTTWIIALTGLLSLIWAVINRHKKTWK